MPRSHQRPSLALALLAATMMTPPGPARSAPGDELGGEFQVNGFTAGLQWQPAVAVDADGDFVVAWESYGQEGPGLRSGIFAQRFDAAGVTQGPEFQVNTFTSDAQTNPSVAMDADGDFVVVWESAYQDGSYTSIFARRFDAAGAAQGGEFQVNTFTADSQEQPSAAVDADGDFVSSQDGDAFGVYARRFQGNGPVAGDFTVDGRADILWRNTGTGTAILWQMAGFAKEATGGIGGAGTQWQVRSLADFNADTKTDVLWRNTSTGSAVVWLMDGFVKDAVGSIGAVPLVWEVQ